MVTLIGPKLMLPTHTRSVRGKQTYNTSTKGVLWFPSCLWSVVMATDSLFYIDRLAFMFS